ncbi:MAG: UPF0149 family protein [Caldimonas sp.]
MNSFSSAPPSRGAVAASDQDLSEAEFGELDEILASVPEPLEPLDAVMLDGFLCGVIVQPRLIDADEWMPFVFDAGGHRWGEAVPGPEQTRARELILRRHSALNRSIAEFGGFDPFVLEPLPSEDDSVEPADPPVDPILATISPWVFGFGQALQLLPELTDLSDTEVDETVARILRFLPVAPAEPALAGGSPASLDAAIGAVVAAVADLYDITTPLRYKVEALRRDTPKVGRNDPCPCGSGRKFKQCHGAASATPR